MNQKVPLTLRGGWASQITIKNISDKTIIAVQMYIQQFDAFNNPLTVYDKSITYSGSLEEGEQTKYKFSSRTTSIDATQAGLWVMKVKFEDGSMWDGEEIMKKAAEVAAEKEAEKLVGKAGKLASTGEISKSEYEEVKFLKLVNEAFAEDFLNKKVQFKCKYLSVMPNKGQYALLNNNNRFPPNMVFFKVSTVTSNDTTVYLSAYNGLAIHKKLSEPLFNLSPFDIITVYGNLKQFTIHTQTYNIIIVDAIERSS